LYRRCGGFFPYLFIANLKKGTQIAILKQAGIALGDFRRHYK
jgi:hypothetical protein